MNFKDRFIQLASGLAISISLAGCSTVQTQDQSAPSNSASSPNSSPKISQTSEATPSPTALKVTPRSTPQPIQASPQLNPPLTVEKLKNAEYFFLAKGPIKLTNGKYTDKNTQRTISLDDVVAYGDLNKDGVKDAVASLRVTIPNSGDVTYLIAAVNEQGNPKNISAEFVGSQVRVKAIAIKPNATIEAKIQQFRPGDPECCPSLELLRTYKIRDSKASIETKAAPKK
ncbi:hypothetical protein AB3R30_05045 [Leptolyngbyaceae cyanobacterium UHCC 1019]